MVYIKLIRTGSLLCHGYGHGCGKDKKKKNLKREVKKKNLTMREHVPPLCYVKLSMPCLSVKPTAQFLKFIFSRFFFPEFEIAQLVEIRKLDDRILKIL